MAGLPLANVLLGIAKIGTDIGISEAEKKKKEELDKKVENLNKDVLIVGNFYDHIYYPVVVNIKRLGKSLDKQPNDIVEKIQKVVVEDIVDGEDGEKAIEIVANILGYIADSVAIGPDFLQILIYLRNKGGSSEPTQNSFEMVPMGEGELVAPSVPDTNTSLPSSTKMENIETGLNVAAVVFGIGALATTVILGVWTLNSLSKAISDVELKQKQITKFYEAMKKVLNPLLQTAKFKNDDYSKLVKICVPKWRKSSEDFESYEKDLYYAIRGYMMKKKTEDVKILVEKYSESREPFPEKAYPIAKQFATEIRKQIKGKKTDDQIITYFSKEYSDVNSRCVFDKYFISTMRPYCKGSFF